jgi:hypothetical protein
MQHPFPAESIDQMPTAVPVRSVRDVISLWPSRKSMADEVEAAGTGVPEEAVTVERVHKWAARGVIPATYHGRVLRAAARRGIDLSAADLVAVHDLGPSTPTSEDAA